MHGDPLRSDFFAQQTFRSAKFPTAKLPVAKSPVTAPPCPVIWKSTYFKLRCDLKKDEYKNIYYLNFNALPVIPCISHLS